MLVNAIKKRLSFALYLLTLAVSLSPKSILAQELDVSVHQHIEIHNCVLWSYRGSVVTLMDVVRKLDEHLIQKGLNDTITLAERYEFYQQSWRTMLQDLIDNELIYQDGIDTRRQVTEAEAKDELVRLYGDQYLTAIDELGMSLPEAIEKLKKELLIQRMFGYHLHYMTSQMITPQMITEAYKEYVEHNPETDIWQYRIVSIRGPKAQGFEKALQLKASIEAGTAIDTLANVLEKDEKKVDPTPSLKVSVSGKFDQTSQEINAKILDELKTLKTLEVSQPLDFSKSESEGVWRLLILEHTEHRSVLSIAQMQRSLQEGLRRKLANAQAAKYLSFLRKRLESEQGVTFYEISHPHFPLFTLRS